MEFDCSIFLLIKIFCCKGAPLVSLISYCFCASNFSSNKSYFSMRKQPMLFKVEPGLWLKLQTHPAFCFDFLTSECPFSGSDPVSIVTVFSQDEVHFKLCTCKALEHREKSAGAPGRL